MKEKKYPKHKYVIGIVKFKDRYLILRFRRRYEYCPGDWDFITKRLDFKFKNLGDVILETVFHHASLKGKIVDKYKSYGWPDPEYKVLWLYYPFLIKVSDSKIELNPDSKYDAFKWVKKDEILNYDRLGYLENVLTNTINKNSK